MPDFRPDVNDDLSTVYAMGPEEILDDVLEPFAAQFKVDFKATDFGMGGLEEMRTLSELALLLTRVSVRSGEVG
ncbi:MAG: hypothetical protein ABIT38_20335 [Gemmatimonadaceae bacterium]